jgi:chromate transporter
VTTANFKTQGRLTQLLLYFLRLGLLGFGGPVALVGQMERELVAERGWLTKEQMREAIAICQSLPGPLAIQVGIYISYLRGGFWGAWIGGWAFIFPNFVIVAALGALYVYFGDLKPITGIFYGVSPRSYRADSPFLLAAFEARHGGQAAMGDRGRLFSRDRDPAGGGRVAV